MSGFTISALTPETFDDFAALVPRNKGMFASCWCRGLAAIALRGAVELIAQTGGGLVEGYPHDTGGIRKKNSSFLSTAPARVAPSARG